MDNQKVTAIFVKSNGGYYHHFGISKKTAILYGDEPKDIVQLEVSRDERQTIPPDDLPLPDYWGWWDFKQERYTMIYPQRFLLNMCFPSGFKACEEVGQGKAYRLKINKDE